MPSNLLNAISKEAGVSLSAAEKAWEKAKSIVDDQYNLFNDQDNYWKLVTGITKKILNISESMPDFTLDQYSRLIDINTYLEKQSDLDDIWMLSEANNKLTYYELRQFLTLLLKNANKIETKYMLDDLLKILGKLEILNKPVPTIAKIKTISPNIF
jgi:hypothetical protein